MSIWKEKKFQNYCIDEDITVIETDDISVPGAIGLYHDDTIYLKPGVKDFIFFHELCHAYQAIYDSGYNEGIANVFAHLCYKAFDIHPDYASGELAETKEEYLTAIRLFKYFIDDFNDSVERSREYGEDYRTHGNLGQERDSSEAQASIFASNEVTDFDDERPTDFKSLGAKKGKERTEVENGRIIQFPNQSIQ